MGFLSGRRIYLALIVVAVAAVLVYSFVLKPPQEITRVIWLRSGGFAGLDDTLTIGSDGFTNLSSKVLGEAEFTLTEMEWEKLRTLIKDSGFIEIDASYEAKAGVADYFSYSLIVEMDSISKQVKWVDKWASKGDLPDGLEKIGEQILEIIQGTGTGGIEGMILDHSGNPLSDYSVSITRGSTGFPDIAAITRINGHYSINSVPPGVFTLGVRGETGKLLTEDTVFVRGGEISRLDFSVRNEILYDQSGGLASSRRGSTSSRLMATLPIQKLWRSSMLGTITGRCRRTPLN